MSNAALIDSNGVVSDVIVVAANTTIAPDGLPIILYNVTAKLAASPQYVLTNYLGLQRGKYAGFGDTYNPVADKFVPPKPFPSWTISAPNWVWTAPTAYPTDGKNYQWNEPTLSWVLQTLI